MKNYKIAISIFLIAFALGLNITGVVPILGILNTLYMEQGSGAVQMLQTIPYLLLMVGSLLIGWLTSKLSKKCIATIGLLLIGICGILPFFGGGYGLVLVSRVLIGFGFGITSPLNTAIVAELFSPEQRAGYMGLHVVGMGIGSMVGNFFGGVLAEIEYHFFFLIYLIAFICLVGMRIFLPQTPPTKAENHDHARLSGKVYLISLASFVHTLFIMVYSTNIAIHVLVKFTSDAAVIGMVTAVNAVFALLVGATFSYVNKFFKKLILPISIFAASIGYAAILWIPGMVVVYIGSACCGASLSCFMAHCSYLISISVNQESVAKASGIFSVIGGIGGLVSPILLGTMAAQLLRTNNTSNQFFISFIGMAVMSAVTLIAVISKPAKRRKQKCQTSQ